MIICKNICKAFSEQVVIGSFSYEFKDRGFYLLLGESGSGKTTFLNILSGILDFDDGEITWNDKAFTSRVEYSDFKNEFDYITQDTFFADFLSVMDNMRLISDSDDKIREALDKFGLSGKENQMPSTLSGGEKQRLAIARAILGGKKVLFLDEPTASLDEENKTAVFEMLAKISAEVLVICSSHDKVAREYANEVIEFTKIKESSKSKSRPQTKKTRKKTKKAVKMASPAAKKRGLYRLLLKWFVSKKRTKRSGVLFAVFAALSFCLCLLGDIPQNKLDSSIEFMYKINMFEVHTAGTTFEQIAPDSDEVRAVVLSYRGSCPDGSEGYHGSDGHYIPLPDYEISLPVLPFDKGAFRLSDKVLYGSYFTSENQVILSNEMANAMNPDDPEALLGKSISKNLYSLGVVDFEIVGIFNKFNSAEKKYLESLGVSIDSGDSYSAEDYGELCFFNSKLTDKYEDDESFYFGNSRSRVYQIYFDTYKDMRAYYDKYYDKLTSYRGVILSYDDAGFEYESLFTILCLVLLPLGLYTAIFTTLFFAALKKTEFQHNSRFIAVFEYSGYEKKEIIRCFILLNILELVIIMSIAELFAFLLTLAINALNRAFLFVSFDIFSYNILLILAYNLLVIIMSSLAVSLLFRRVRVLSWYESLISSRDLI